MDYVYELIFPLWYAVIGGSLRTDFQVQMNNISYVFWNLHALVVQGKNMECMLGGEPGQGISRYFR